MTSYETSTHPIPWTPRPTVSFNLKRRLQSGLSSFVSRTPLVTLAVVLSAFALFLLPELSAQLEFQREAVANGQWYRLLTGHLVHWSPNHFLWDAITFCVLGSLVELTCVKRRSTYLFGLVVAGLLISLSILIASPQYLTYRGLSGLCFTVFAAIALVRYREAKMQSDRILKNIAIVALLLMFAKFGYEAATCETLFTKADEFTMIPLSHFAGAIAGLAGVGIGGKTGCFVNS